MTVRSTIKSAVESILAAPPIATIAAQRVQQRTLILAYHNIAADDTANRGDRSLHLPLSTFAAQLDVLQHAYDVIPLSAALSAPGARPRVVITFDDAYEGAVRLGLAELARRSLPATVFVSPGKLDGASFWWDVFATGADGLAPATRAHALEQLQGNDALVRAWARTRDMREQSLPPEYRTATEDALRRATENGNVLLGSHTWSHCALPTLSPADLTAEIERPLTWLRERFTSVVPWLSYPYGLSSPTVAAAAKRAGYDAACLVAGGWVPASVSDRFALPRQNIAVGLSTGGFKLRLAGMFCE